MEFMPLNVRITIQISFKITDPALNRVMWWLIFFCLKNGHDCFQFPGHLPHRHAWTGPQPPKLSVKTFTTQFQGFWGLSGCHHRRYMYHSHSPLHHNQHGQHNTTSPQGDSKEHKDQDQGDGPLCHPPKSVCLLEVFIVLHWFLPEESILAEGASQIQISFRRNWAPELTFRRNWHSAGTHTGMPEWNGNRILLERNPVSFFCLSNNNFLSKSPPHQTSITTSPPPPPLVSHHLPQLPLHDTTQTRWLRRDGRAEGMERGQGRVY